LKCSRSANGAARAVLAVAGRNPVPSWVVGNDLLGALPAGGVAVTPYVHSEEWKGLSNDGTGKELHHGQVLEWHDRPQGWSVVEDR